MATTIDIPKRALYKTAEVCSIAQVQPYVLRSWETEFPGLGRAKGGGARVYRRADVELVLEIKRLVYQDGLTLGAARRQLGGDRQDGSVEDEGSIAELLGQDARERIADVKEGLRAVLAMLSTNGHPARGPFDQAPQPTPEVALAPRHAVKARAPRKVKARAPASAKRKGRH